MRGNINLRFGDPIVIDWTDAGGHAGWSEISTYEPPKIQSIGYFMKHDKEGLYYASGFEKEDPSMALHLGFIPHGCLKKVRKLKG